MSNFTAAHHAAASTPRHHHQRAMFLERTGNGFGPRGWIEVICGSMFSGKTEELIRRSRRAEFAKMRVETFKPAVDTRYDEQKVVSHDQSALHSTPVRSSSELLAIADDVQVVVIDEAQFFDPQLPEVCATLAARGVRVIVAGLDMDFQGRPFGPMPQMMAMAEFVTKVHAICMRCGELATFSHRTHHSTDLIHLGETDSYEPLCRPCFEKARAEQAAMAKKQGSQEGQQ